MKSNFCNFFKLNLKLDPLSSETVVNSRDQMLAKARDLFKK
jgi:hypothetical protein